MGDTVIEMSKIRMDFARSEITGQTLRIIDWDFFDQIVAPQNGVAPTDEAREGPNYAELSSKVANGINKMLQPRQKIAPVPQSYFTNPFQDSQEESIEGSDYDENDLDNLIAGLEADQIAQNEASLAKTPSKDRIRKQDNRLRNDLKNIVEMVSNSQQGLIELQSQGKDKTQVQNQFQKDEQELGFEVGLVGFKQFEKPNSKVTKEILEQTDFTPQKPTRQEKMQLRSSATKEDSSAKKRTLIIEPDQPKKRTYKHLTDPEVEQNVPSKVRKISDFFKKAS